MKCLLQEATMKVQSSFYSEKCKYQRHTEWPMDVSEAMHSVNALVHLLFQQSCIAQTSGVVRVLQSCKYM